MMGARKLSEDQAREIAEKREAGWSYGRLATKFGVSAGAIHYQCLRQGAISPRTHGAGQRKGPAVIQASDGRTQRRFTPAEDARMLELATGGAKVRQICDELGRAPTSIKIRLLTLALHDEQLA